MNPEILSVTVEYEFVKSETTRPLPIGAAAPNDAGMWSWGFDPESVGTNVANGVTDNHEDAVRAIADNIRADSNKLVIDKAIVVVVGADGASSSTPMAKYLERIGVAEEENDENGGSDPSVSAGGNVIRIAKVGYRPGGDDGEKPEVVVIYNQIEDGDVHKQFQLKSEEPPMASLPDALSALAPHVRDLIGGSSLGAIRVGSVTFDRKKSGMGCTIAFKVAMPDGRSPLCANTPFRLMNAKKARDESAALDDDFVEALEEVIRQGKMYVDGRHLQPRLSFDGEGGADAWRSTPIDQFQIAEHLVGKISATMHEGRPISTAGELSDWIEAGGKLTEIPKLAAKAEAQILAELDRVRAGAVEDHDAEAAPEEAAA